jgi:hypothetical protein
MGMSIKIDNRTHMKYAEEGISHSAESQKKKYNRRNGQVKYSDGTESKKRAHSSSHTCIPMRLFIRVNSVLVTISSDSTHCMRSLLRCIAHVPRPTLCAVPAV